MKKRLIVLLWAAACVIGLGTGAQAAVVLDFEDAYGVLDPSYDPADQSYAGFTWSHFFGVLSEDEEHPDYGYGHGNVTEPGEYYAYNGWGYDVSVSRDDAFTFIGGYFIAGDRYSDTDLTITGTLDGTLVYSNTIDIPTMPSTTNPSWFELNITNVDTITFSGTRFCLDEFTYTAVPLPGAALLLASGLIGLAAARRNRCGGRALRRSGVR